MQHLMLIIKHQSLDLFLFYPNYTQSMSLFVWGILKPENVRHAFVMFIESVQILIKYYFDIFVVSQGIALKTRK